MSNQDATRASDARPRPSVVTSQIDGNAFAVLGAVQNALRRAGYSRAELDAYFEEATSGDYANLLAVSMRYVDFT